MESEAKNEKDFILLKRLIKKKLGFNGEQYKQSHFKRRLDVRLRGTGSRSYAEYINYLTHNNGEYELLMKALTVNVTKFFRNPETYDIIEKEVIPEIIRSKDKRSLKHINIWSAGCANGVEVYSIAIMLHRLLGDDFKGYKITITGTDIDEPSLSKAQQGIYNDTDIKELNPTILRKYFEKEDNGYRVIKKIRDITRFKRHDMISGQRMRGFDAIFCRNVTIYFEKELQEMLYMNFYEGLNMDGFFIMGKTETLVGPSKDAFKPFNSKERIYKKA